MVSKILLLILTLFSFQAYSRTVFDDTVKSVSRISDDYAVDRVEYFVWGYIVATKNDCKPVDTNVRRIADKAWLDIKYMNDTDGKSLVFLVAYWMQENYKCNKVVKK